MIGNLSFSENIWQQFNLDDNIFYINGFFTGMKAFSKKITTIKEHSSVELLETKIKFSGSKNKL